MSSTEGQALPVLFEDAHLLAVHKPSGMPVQPDPTGDLDLLTALRAQRREPSLELVHRIDRPVSGVVLLARTAEVNAQMSALFRERRASKRYLAIVEGSLPPGELQWDLMNALRHDARAHRSRVVKGEDESSPLHALHVSLKAQGDRYALVEVVPEGGAFHQIRAQLASWGHAIKGDVKYGARRGEKDRSIALHAHAISFMHPMTSALVSIEAPAPTGTIWTALLAIAQR